MPNPDIIPWLVVRGGFDTHKLEELWSTDSRDLYNTFEIRAGRGHRRRVIEEPVQELKEIQKTLIPLYEQFPFHPACTAIKGRSISDNALPHKDAKHVLKVDIRKCYPSTTTGHLHSALQRHIHDTTLKNFMISGLHFCFLLKNERMVLPTGAPTSPLLCNMALTSMDEEIAMRVEGLGYTYTRYMDDLTISTKNNNRMWSLLYNIEHTIFSYHYKMNKRKTRWLMNECGNDKLIVTGVRVAKGRIVPKEFRRMLRAKMQNLAKEGRPLDPETRGCLAYIKSIDQEEYKKFNLYWQRRRQYAPNK